MRRTFLDACVLINLLATGHLGQIARATRTRFVAVREVAGEAFYLDPPQAGGERTQVTLAELTDAGDLEVVDLEDRELDAFVDFAGHLDDGEAATLAAAYTRDLPLATDDRGALRLISQMQQPPEVIQTSQLLRRWAAEAIPAAEVAAALSAVETRANFVPGARDPEQAWWHDQLGRVA